MKRDLEPREGELSEFHPVKLTSQPLVPCEILLVLALSEMSRVWLQAYWDQFSALLPVESIQCELRRPLGS